MWLEITPPTRLEYQRITAVPDLAKGTAAVSVEVGVSNAATSEATVGYRLRISRNGQTVYRTESPEELRVPAGDSARATLRFALAKDQVALWHFNHPHRYTARVELLRNGRVTHQLTDRFGIRQVEIDGYAFKLNGEAVRTVGFNLVAEDRTTGNTLPLWRIKEDVDLMKSLGVNMARLSHLPLPKAFLDYLDERGIMTFEEVSLWGKDALVDPEHPTPKEWLERMVAAKYNHPSVVGWSLGNEIGYLHDNPLVREYVQGAVRHAKTLDPTRLAVYVSHSANDQANDPVEFSDLIMLNKYGGWGGMAEATNRLHPGKPIFMAEYGKELNSENPAQATIDAQEMLEGLRGKEYVVGASLWTFNDYRSFWKSTPTWTTPPSQNRAWGVVNTFRQKKQPFFTFRKEYAPVRGLSLSTQGAAASVTITPRHVLDIPAYTLGGYRLVWATYNQQDQLTNGGLVNLPVINPGSEQRSFPIGWSADASTTRLEVHLLDPQDYSVLDTVVHGQAPQATTIRSVHTSATKARVVFAPVTNATAYHLRYRAAGADFVESPTTTNHFIEVDSLAALTEYDFQVVAVNPAGAASPSEVATARTDADELPPIIWKTVPADQAFFVGYTVEMVDYLYEVAYGTAPGRYADTLSLRNVGVLKVPHVKNGQTYYYRMRSRKQWGFASEWTHEVAVTPNGEAAPDKPRVHGVLRQDSVVVINYDPVPMSTGYEVKLTHQETGQEQLVPIGAAQLFFSSVALPTGWPPKEVRIALRSINRHGASDWVEVPDPTR
ncbi:MAG: glycoside hydrolase family 2 TIM barrel-domain containing protein [Tunicatimonas sp.]